MTDKIKNEIRIPEDPKEAEALLAALQKQKKFARKYVAVTAIVG